jgi:hypothetical protein
MTGAYERGRSIETGGDIFVRRLLIAGLAIALLAGAVPVAAGTIDFQNDEFNFHVTFPVGSQVCPAVTSNHPYGFYAWYGQPTACGNGSQNDAKPEAAASAMGVYATYNSTYQRSLVGLLPKACRPKPNPPADAKNSASSSPASDSTSSATPLPVPEAKPAPAPVDAKTLSGLNFRRYKSLQCVTVAADGSIDIDVVTQAGKWVDGNDPGFQTPLVNFRASLHTTPDRLEKDVPMFRIFLQKVDIRY